MTVAEGRGNPAAGRGRGNPAAGGGGAGAEVQPNSSPSSRQAVNEAWGAWSALGGRQECSGCPRPRAGPVQGQAPAGLDLGLSALVLCAQGPRLEREEAQQHGLRAGGREQRPVPAAHPAPGAELSRPLLGSPGWPKN